MLVSHDADRGVNEMAEDRGREAPVHGSLADELAGDEDDAGPGAAVELEPRLDGVDWIGGRLRDCSRDRREVDPGEGVVEDAALATAA